MKFSCNQDTFSKYLNVVSRILTGKQSMPILNNVKISAKNGRLTLTSTDLEIGMTCWLGADVLDEGDTTVPGKQLAEYIASLPSEKVDVSLNGNILSVKSTNNVADFNVIPSQDFPSVDFPADDKPLFIISRENLLKVTNRVNFATAVDNIKPVFTGVLVEFLGKDNRVSFVGADSLRLSRQIIKAESVNIPTEEGKKNKDLTLLIPARALEEVANVVSNLADSENDLVEVFLLEGKNQVMFKFNDVQVISRLLDGQYPDYKSIIPSGYETKCTIAREDFLNSLKVVNIIARNTTGNKVVFNMNTKENKVVLSASLADVGSNESSFGADIQGTDLQIAFNGKFINEFLSHIDGDTIIFEGSSPVKAGIFRIKDDPDYLYLMAPMML